MTKTRYGESEQDSWPWAQLLDPEVLKNWLDGDFGDEADEEHEEDEKEVSVPRSLQAMLRTMKDVSLGEQWAALLEGEEPVPIELLLETRDALIDCGYRKDLVESFVVALIAGYMNSLADLDLNLSSSSVARLTLDIAKAVLGGLTGGTNEEAVKWLFKCAGAYGMPEAEDIILIIDGAAKGDKHAREAIIKIALPYWNLMIDAGLFQRWGIYPEALGFSYNYIDDIKERPDVLAFKANLLYEYGHAGEDYEAVEMAVEAAIGGSEQAWRLLNKWRNVGDESLVLDYLISVGSKKLTGVDCLSDND